jgi:hypothetical protein
LKLLLTKGNLQIQPEEKYADKILGEMAHIKQVVTVVKGRMQELISQVMLERM